MLILGDSGAGKSTFNLHLEHHLWINYKRGYPIPLFINLPGIDRPDQELVSKQLKIYNFDDDQIKELKLNREFIVICDGYDESQLTSNIYMSNSFNLSGQWRVKMVVTCRTQYLGSSYRSWFMPQGISAYDRIVKDLFQEAVVAPFTKEQIKRYIEIYVPLEIRTWSTKDYMDRLTAIPNLMGLVRNPFLLSLALEALPGVTDGTTDLSAITVTRVQLYDTFVQHWFKVNQRRLQSNNALSRDDQNVLVQLVEAGFVSLGIQYSTKLALAINPIKNCEEFDPQAETNPRISLSLDTNNPLFQRDLLEEPSIIQFLCDRIKLNQDFKQQLRKVIDLSKTDTDAITAAANAITILVRAGVSFNGADLRGIRVPRANLSNGQFDSAQFQGADLKGVDLSKSWLRQADMSDTHMEGVQFGESPYLEIDKWVCSCAYSPDGKMLGVGLFDGAIYIYDTLTWSRVHRLEGHAVMTRSIAFSPDSQQLVSSSFDKTVRSWNTTSGEQLLIMDRHGDKANSVAFSSCGSRIAKASNDMTVRLWNIHTGECLFVLEGHEGYVIDVKYSPDGRQVVSGGKDGTIRFWDAETGAPGAVLELLGGASSSTSYQDALWIAVEHQLGLLDMETGTSGADLKPFLGGVFSLAFSPDARWIAAGHQWGHLQLWGANSFEPGPIFSGHTETVLGIVFFQSCQRLASSSDDHTIRLWDVSTSALVTVLTSHNNSVSSIALTRWLSDRIRRMGQQSSTLGGEL
jgi:WD40 repeat protein